MKNRLNCFLGFVGGAATAAQDGEGLHWRAIMSPHSTNRLSLRSK